MDLKEYLTTLSKENLVSLLMDLSDINKEVRIYLTEKQNALPVLSEQNEPTSPVADTLFNSTPAINRHSTPQQKIDLFKSLFSGRQDVFALRWFNPKSNKSGYFPVCRNKWASGKCDLKKYSCATCPFKLPVSLTDNYIYNHLAGRDEFSRDVIGLYPLMEENLCKFLAMDFDTHVPQGAKLNNFHSCKQCEALYAHAPKAQKSIISSLIAERNVNTLILVQSHALLEQWKKAIKQFLDITPGTIAAGKDKSTGIVDIAIVNSLIEKGSDELRPRSYKYGMLIVDECHHVSAFSTENLVASFKAKYVYGLTATPIRRDGHQKIIFYQCGSVLYSTTTKQMNAAQDFAHYFIPRFSSFHYVPELTESKNPSINQYYEKLISNLTRNELIIADVKNAVKDGRTPLILSERIEHLNILYEKLSDSAQNVIFITGRGTQKQKNETLEKLKAVPADESLIILATGKYAGEGFDYPRIDTLMLAMPFSWKGTLAQYCGRLHRNFAGKNEVQIFDYVDYRIPVFDRMYQNRLKGYKHLGYSIKQNISENAEIQTESKLYSAEDYKSDFQKDILSAASKIIISVPYLSKVNVQEFVLSSTTLLVKGVNIQILVRKQNDDAKQKKIAPCISMLENIGIKVIEQENISQKITIIDEKIMWYGNINFLGYTENEECCMRIVDNKIASEIESEILKP